MVFFALVSVDSVPRPRLGADVVESGTHRVIKAVVQPVWLDGVKARHPVILAIFKQASIHQFGVLVMVSHLFDQRKACVVIKLVPREGEMMVEGSSLGFRHIRAVCVEAQVRRRFGLADILGIRAP